MWKVVDICKGSGERVELWFNRGSLCFCVCLFFQNVRDYNGKLFNAELGRINIMKLKKNDNVMEKDTYSANIDIIPRTPDWIPP